MNADLQLRTENQGLTTANCFCDTDSCGMNTDFPWEIYLPLYCSPPSGKSCDESPSRMLDLEQIRGVYVIQGSEMRRFTRAPNPLMVQMPAADNT